MVDFQSRDTRRGPVTDDEEDEEEPDAAEETDETAAETDPGMNEASEPATESTTADQQAAAADTEAGVTEPEVEPEPEPEPESESESESVTESEPGSRSESPSQSQSQSQSQPAQTAAAKTDATDTAQQSAEPTRALDVAVVTVGEASESAVTEAFESAGHTISTRERLRGDYDGLQQAVDTLVGRADVDVVVTTGGVGIEPDEMAIEAVHPLLEKALPGFGEAFRSLLYDTIGTGIVAVRTAAGVADDTLVFCLPGDAGAARLAVEEILVTEAPELVAHLDS